jgi:uncharacterized phage-like protein YoqJ
MTISLKYFLKERSYSLMGTGHRPKLYVEYSDYYESLSVMQKSIEAVISKYEIKLDVVISGMALGFDTALAMYAVSNNIPLHIYSPFIGQEYSWSDDYIGTYTALVKQAERVHFSTNRYPANKGAAINALYKRNADMLQSAEVCLTFKRPEVDSGGTVSAIKKAKEMKIITVPVWTEYKKQAAISNVPIKKLIKFKVS